MAEVAETSKVTKIFKDLVEKNIAVPVAAMNTLTSVIRESDATTWMELEQELRSAIESLKKNCSCDDLGGRTNISLNSGCDLFMKYVTRAFNLEYLEFDSCKQELLRRGENLSDTSLRARNQIAELGHSFITDGCTVLVHGSSRVVTSLILKAAQTKAFTVVVTEAKPVSDFFNCFEHAEAYAAAGIPTKIVMDSAVGSVMESCDLCILGAEGVMENGGIVNKVGTYQIALCAKALRKPFYVAVESYKFARYYPLCQKDIQHLGGMGGRKTSSSKQCDSGSVTQSLDQFKDATSLLRKSGSGSSSSINTLEDAVGQAQKNALRQSAEGASSGAPPPAEIVAEVPTIDYTPAHLITLLFTDMGVLTPAAVSDELIRLYC